MIKEYEASRKSKDLATFTNNSVTNSLEDDAENYKFTKISYYKDKSLSNQLPST